VSAPRKRSSAALARPTRSTTSSRWRSRAAIPSPVSSVAGLPKTIHITSQEIREALADTIASIVDAVRVTLERCPPELSADLVDRGFVMAGGGALIRGIDKLLSEKTGLPVTVSDDPLSAVANGTGAVLNDLSWLMQNV
jgi:rod shape-determining protein MreB and related proteins